MILEYIYLLFLKCPKCGSDSIEDEEKQKEYYEEEEKMGRKKKTIKNNIKYDFNDLAHIDQLFILKRIYLYIKYSLLFYSVYVKLPKNLKTEYIEIIETNNIKKLKMFLNKYEKLI